MKKNTKTILFIIFLLLAVGGGLYYYFFIRKIPEITQVSDPQEVDETANWSVYTNEKIGYSIKYPPGWYMHEKGYNPPPPTQAFFLTVPEGKTKGEYSSISIFADKILTEELKDYQEIANLTLKGYERSEIEFAGKEAIRLDNPKDNSGSIYFKKSYYIIRINWGSTDPVLDERHKDVFGKILNTFEGK